MENTQQGKWVVTIRHDTCSKDQNRLEALANWNFMNAQKSKGKVLHMREKESMQSYRLGLSACDTDSHNMM